MAWTRPFIWFVKHTSSRRTKRSSWSRPSRCTKSLRPPPVPESFQFPTSKVLAHTTSAKTRLIAVANPNNPTGAAASAEDLLLIARSAPQAAVLVDEAYFEFHGESLLERAG